MILYYLLYPTQIIMYYNYYPLIQQNLFNTTFSQQYALMQNKYRFFEEQNKKLKESKKKLQQAIKKIKKRKRRSVDQFEKLYECTFLLCKKSYTSQLALNLHIDKKHNGGNKTQRQQVARAIILAEEKGQQMPIVTIQFPPGYLKEFKKQFFKSCGSNDEQ